jgi:hypothetical protein
VFHIQRKGKERISYIWDIWELNINYTGIKHNRLTVHRYEIVCLTDTSSPSSHQTVILLFLDFVFYITGQIKYRILELPRPYQSCTGYESVTCNLILDPVFNTTPVFVLL